MSQPKTKPIPETHQYILEDLPIGHIATIRADGLISVNPVGLMWDGEYVRVSTVKNRMKYKNLLKDPRVSISVPHRNNPNVYVEIRGTAILTDDPDRSFINSIARHYMNVDEYPFDNPGDERVTITIVAQQVSAPPIPLAENPPGAPDQELQTGEHTTTEYSADKK